MNIDINPDDFTAAKQAEQDKHLLVKFEYRPWKNAAKTLEAGRPIYEDKLYIDIRVPGQRDPICRPATQQDIKRFPEHYDAFMKRTEEPQELGTLLSEWPLVTRSQVEELAFFNIKTVEHLATMPDSGAQNFRGFQTLKNKAKEWLEQTKDKDRIEKEFSKREQSLKDELDALRDELEQLKAAKQKTAKKKATKKRGRPPKVKNVSDSDSDSE